MKLTRMRPAMKMPGTRNDRRLAVITCHFNFAGYNRPRQNLCRFIRQMNALSIPTYGVELHLEGTQAFTDQWENWRQITCDSGSVMFQKEALLNIAETMVPEHHDVIAWIDADVMLTSRVWFNDVVQHIDTGYCVCQLFDRVALTDIDGTTTRTWKGCCAEKTLDTRTAHTGFAWAADRSLWRECGGLYPYAISGSGDVIMASAFMNLPLSTAYQKSLGVNNPFDRWLEKVSRWCKARFTHVNGTIYHEWHGSVANRAYAERRDMMAGLDVAGDLVLDNCGVLRWNAESSTDGTAREQIRRYLKEYFTKRNED